jgi:endonuclease G
MKRIIIFILAGFLFSSCSKVSSEESENVLPTDKTPISSSMARIATDNLLLGNPSNAQTSTTTPTNYLMQKTQFALSYNRDQGKPNWVSWHLDPTWIGSAARCDCFWSDATLPTGWYRVGNSSYTNSGFDRGHNCPSADRTYSSTDNKATFLMTNMMPQAPMNNQRTWAYLENYCRTLMNQGNELYIICGSYGSGGYGSNGYKTTIDNGRVTVPNRIWKVIVVIPRGSNDLSRITTSTRVIAVNTPNANDILTTWGTYRTSVDAIENATGYDILSNIPDAIETTLETNIDNGPTQ